MRETPFVLRAEHEIYVEYDRERRLRVSRYIAPAFVTILSLLIIASQIAPDQFHGTRSNIGLILLCDGLFILGAISAWRRMVNTATASILGAALLIMVLSVLANQPFILSDLFTIPAVVIIGLSALIGLPWMILATTAGTTIFTLVLSQAMVLRPDMLNHNNVNSVGAFIVEQWALAIIVFAAARGYRRILRQISDVRVQYERAKKLEELKDQFITSVNHELRNPVMMVQGNMELLRLKGKELSPERRDMMIERASQASDKLSQLVQSILDVRRLDQGSKNFEPEPVPVFDAVASAAALVDPSDGGGVERDLRVHAPRDLALWGEPIRMQQILTNLLSNALKYSKPGTAIDVTARLVTTNGAEGGQRWRFLRREPLESHMVEIRVRDYGFGIPPEQAPLLFQRFVRLPRDLASTTVGNGLGLYLCRELTEAMGGRIWVESDGVDGEGSAFYLRFPVPPSDVRMTGAPEATSNA
jgi:signal transduction histidine kinase